MLILSTFQKEINRVHNENNPIRGKVGIHQQPVIRLKAKDTEAMIRAFCLCNSLAYSQRTYLVPHLLRLKMANNVTPVD